MGGRAAQLADQARRSGRALVIAVVAALGVMTVAAVASLAVGVPLGDFTSDPLSRLGANPLTGFVSNLGILLWAGAAGACLVATLALRYPADPSHGEARRFFGVSLALTTLLVLDDLFQIHEDLVPRLFGRGQTFILGGYVVLVAGYLWRFRRLLPGTEWLLLAAAGLGFAVSIGVDLLPVLLNFLPGDVQFNEDSLAYDLVAHLLEDGAKLLGISLWFTYFVRTAVAYVSRRMRDVPPIPA